MWWANDTDSTVPATIKLWTALDPADKEELVIQGYCLFPELFNAKSGKKYNRFALWLASQKGVVNTNIRDSFSAGGQVILPMASGIERKMPAVFGRVAKYRHLIEEVLLSAPDDTLQENWNVDTIKDNRIKQWCHLVALEADQGVGYSTAIDVLRGIFYQYF